MRLTGGGGRAPQKQQNTTSVWRRFQSLPDLGKKVGLKGCAVCILGHLRWLEFFFGK